MILYYNCTVFSLILYYHRAIFQIKEEITGEFQTIFLDQEDTIGKLKEKIQQLEERLEKQENVEVTASKKPTIDPDLSVCTYMM